MIPADRWVEQIVSYAKFVCDRAAVQKAWVWGDCSDTSISNFDELIEQVFDDLDSDEMEKVALTEEHAAAAYSLELRGFLDALRKIDFARSVESRLLDDQVLLQSDRWSLVEAAAAALVGRAETQDPNSVPHKAKS
jgi:hypothetical protein